MNSRARRLVCEIETRFTFLRRVQERLVKTWSPRSYFEMGPFAANVLKPVPVKGIAFVCQTHGNVFNYKMNPLHPICNNEACGWTYVGHLREDPKTPWLMFDLERDAVEKGIARKHKPDMK
jgi:hypothetical protein